MEQFIGCDAHKKFSVFVAVNEKGQAGEALRVNHERHYIGSFCWSVKTWVRSATANQRKKSKIRNLQPAASPPKECSNKPTTCKPRSLCVASTLERIQASPGAHRSDH